MSTNMEILRGAPEPAPALPPVQYVAGLMFTKDQRRVALIEKRKPAWQAGLWNAIGGKIEAGETAREAMIREFEEEAGVIYRNWELVAVLCGPDFVVHFFAAFSDVALNVRTMETETVCLRACRDGMVEDCELMPNLRVIIPIALDDTGIVKPVSLYDARAAATLPPSGHTLQ
jgi:ADP-ribose pyrophosphatase YjhB (NUDIX family)